MIKKILIYLSIIIIISSCSSLIRNPVVRDLQLKNKNAIIKGNSLKFFIHESKVNFYEVMTRKKFNRFKIRFVPLREQNPNNGFSVFFHYQSDEQYYRLNIFLDTGMIHLYLKDGKKILNLTYESIKAYYSLRQDNLFDLAINDDKIILTLNNQEIYSGNLQMKKGKVGFGVYGKGDEVVQFIFK